MRRPTTIALATGAFLIMSAGSAFAADCYVANKPTGAGTEGVFTTFHGTDFFYPLPDAPGLPDAHFGNALPDGARSSGPGDGCGYGIDSAELC